MAAERFVAGSFSSFASKVASMQCPFVVVENGIVNIDNRITLNGNDGLTAIKDGTTFAVAKINWYGAGSHSVNQYIAVSDTVFYICMRGYYESRLELIYEKINGHNYYGFVASEGNGRLSYQELSQFPIRDVDDSSIEYRHLALLNYACQEGNVDYTEEILMKVLSKDGQGRVTSYERAFSDPNLVACTAVPTNKKITVNDKIYYSLSQNCMFKIGGEET